MINNLKIKLIGLAILAGIILLFICFILYTSFSGNQTIQEALPTPTSVTASLSPQRMDSSHITPLQKTTINQTTDDQVSRRSDITSRTKLGDTTIYQIKSAIPGIDDEIRTKDGKVVFESTATVTASPPPPKMSTIIDTFGEPQLTQQNVGVGWYTSGYLYPSQGLAFFANTSTGTVYQVQRFIPMTLESYKLQYPEYLQKKVSQPEYFDKQ